MRAIIDIDLKEHADVVSIGTGVRGNLGKRARSKIERRQRLIDAARDMITEAGDVGFSMRALSDQAGVSLMTVYNYIDSRETLLLEVLRDEINAGSTSYADMLGSDPLGNLLGIIPFIRRRFEAKPAFWKAVYMAFFQGSASELRQVAIESRVGLWRQIITSAQDEGVLCKDLSADQILDTLNSAYLYNVFVLFSSDGNMDTFERRAQRSFIVVLLSSICSDARQELLERLPSLADTSMK